MGRHVVSQDHLKLVAEKRIRGVVVNERGCRQVAVGNDLGQLFLGDQPGRPPIDLVDPADDAVLKLDPVASAYRPFNTERDAREDIGDHVAERESDDGNGDAGRRNQTRDLDPESETEHGEQGGEPHDEPGHIGQQFGNRDT